MKQYFNHSAVRVCRMTQTNYYFKEPFRHQCLFLESIEFVRVLGIRCPSKLFEMIKLIKNDSTTHRYLLFINIQ